MVDRDDRDAEVGAASVEPGLNPNQPNARMNGRASTIGCYAA